MSALHFRFDRHAFFRAAQMPSRHRRHPLLRLLMGLLGLAVLLVLVGASVFVGAAMLTIGLDFVAILDELVAQQFPGWVVIEQSRSDVSPAESARINAKYLRDHKYAIELPVSGGK